MVQKSQLTTLTNGLTSSKNRSRKGEKMNNKLLKLTSSFCRSESGVSVAVAAALLLGIIVIAITTIQLNYVPVWKEDAEYAHMSDVWQDMSRLKSNVDILAAGLEINPNAKIVVNTPIQVGGADVPFIGGTTTGGTLAVNKDISGLSINVTTNTSSGGYPGSFLYTGTVTYRPTNTYYVDETYSYENGALVVASGGRSMMKLAPGITLENGISENHNTVNLSVDVVVLNGSMEMVSSNTVENIKLTSKSFNHTYAYTALEKSIYNNNITSASVTVYTENTEAWNKYFTDLADAINLQNGTDYNLNTYPQNVTFSLSPVNKDIYVDVYKTTIKVEAGV
jgi:hypothetical protein